MLTHHFKNRIACGLGILCAASATAQDKTNFVLMIADDVSWDDIGYYGNNQVKTPNIDISGEPVAQKFNATKNNNKGKF
jgi:superfamily I DNA and RNA helicase